jgi:glycosyltransferase involved in cell wall biosynthesis
MPRSTDLPALQSGREGWPWVSAAGTLPSSMPGGGPWPTISVIMPSYNQAAFVEEAIRSVLLQGYPALEFIVVDGGSSDGAAEIIKKYSEHFSHLICEPDRGQSDAINKGYRLSTGDIVSWLNSDDVLFPGALEAVALFFQHNPNFAFVSGTSEYRDATGLRSTHTVDRVPSKFSEIFSYCAGLYFPQPSVFINNKALRNSGLVDERLHYTMDLDLWMRLSQTAPIAFIDKKLSWMRQHDDAKTWRDEAKVLHEVEFVFKRYAASVAPSVLSRALRDCRRRQAAHKVQLGLAAVKRGDLTLARLSLKEAGRTSSAIVLERSWIGLAIRAWLPSQIQKRILNRPC